MNHDKFSNLIQAMSFTENLIGLTSGTIGNITTIYCSADGGFTITFPSGGTKAVTMTAGTVRTVTRGSTVEITAGTFDLD